MATSIQNQEIYPIIGISPAESEEWEGVSHQSVYSSVNHGNSPKLDGFVHLGSSPQQTSRDSLGIHGGFVHTQQPTMAIQSHGELCNDIDLSMMFPTAGLDLPTGFNLQPPSFDGSLIAIPNAQGSLCDITATNMLCFQDTDMTGVSLGFNLTQPAPPSLPYNYMLATQAWSQVDSATTQAQLMAGGLSATGNSPGSSNQSYNHQFPTSDIDICPLNIPDNSNRPRKGKHDGVTTGRVKKRESASKMPKETIKFNFVMCNAENGTLNDHESWGKLKRKGRKGPLEAAQAAKAKKVRERGACFPCKWRKVACGDMENCMTCRKRNSHPTLRKVICWKFSNFTNTLFPSFMTEPLTEDKVHQFCSENIAEFLYDGRLVTLEIDISAGVDFDNTLKLNVQCFTPKKILVSNMLDANAKTVEFRVSNSLPIAINPNVPDEVTKMKTSINNYIQEIIKEQSFSYQVTDDLKASPIPYDIVVIVREYALTSRNPLAMKALELHAMHYIMTRLLNVAGNSRDKFVKYGISVPSDQWISSRVLNRQVKAYINEIRQDKTTKLYDALGTTLMGTSSTAWVPCTAAFLMLCLLMEHQSGSVEILISSINKLEIQEGRKPRYKQSVATGHCREIEKMPFEQFLFQFHQIFHSHEQGAKAFNPLRQIPSNMTSLDQASAQFIYSLRTKIRENVDAMSIMACQSATHKDNDWPVDPITFYTMRLISRFLLSFRDERFIFNPPSISEVDDEEEAQREAQELLANWGSVM